jgi:hypothetical protein
MRIITSYLDDYKNMAASEREVRSLEFMKELFIGDEARPQSARSMNERERFSTFMEISNCEGVAAVALHCFFVDAVPYGDILRWMMSMNEEVVEKYTVIEMVDAIRNAVEVLRGLTDDEIIDPMGDESGQSIEEAERIMMHCQIGLGLAERYLRQSRRK